MGEGSVMDTDTGVSQITDHPFNPGPNPWWERCWHPGCHLGAAAHAATAVYIGPDPALPYRCPNCVMTGKETCSHGR
jgi:hypothetical protein